MTCADCEAEGADCLYAGYARVCGDCLYDRVLADRDEHKAKREEYASEARSLRERLKDALRERDEARAEVERLRKVLLWLNRRGGLGLAVHEYIDAALAPHKYVP